MTAPQHDANGGRASTDATTSAAMELGAAMARANDEIEREPYGVELARRASLAARAAYMALVDASNPESFGMDVRVVTALCQQQYAGEWNRLQHVAREDWHR